MNRPVLAFICLTLSSASFAAGDPLRKVSKEIRKEIRTLENPRVALLTFPYHNGKISSGSSILSERLTTYMAESKGIRVVERNLLKKLLEEQHLSETGVVDDSAAKKLGKVAGVDVIITGTLNDMSRNRTEVNVRAIKATTGEILGASSVIVERVWTDPPRYPNQKKEYALPPDEPEEKPVPNEAIEVGIPGGRGGGPRGGGYYGGR